jgi:hypothetical protein
MLSFQSLSFQNHTYTHNKSHKIPCTSLSHSLETHTHTHTYTINNNNKVHRSLSLEDFVVQRLCDSTVQSGCGDDERSVGDRVELHDGVCVVLLVLVSCDIVVGEICCAMYAGKSCWCCGVQRGRAVCGCNMRIPYLWVSIIIIINLTRSSIVYFIF